MTQWNPNAPEIIGLEWAASRQGNDALVSLGSAFAQRTRSLLAETIGSFELWASSFGNGRLYMEVYTAGNEVCSAPVAEIMRPTGDDTVVAVQNQAAAIVNLYQSVDEAVLNSADYITQTGAASAGIYSATYSAAAAWPVARRVLDVSMTYVVNATTSTAQQVTAHVLDGTGNDLIVRKDVYSVGQGAVTFTASCGPDNPFTALPWSQADIVALGSAAADLELALVFEDYLGGQPDFRLLQLFITVTYCTENRLAVASCAVPTGATFGVRTMSNVRVPDTGVANWAKGNAVTYTYALRLGTPAQTVGSLVRLSGFVSLPWVDSGSVAPLQTNGTAESYQFTLATGARVTSIGTAATRLRGVLPVTTGPAASESGQPYVSSGAFANGVDSVGCWGTNVPAQRVTTTLARTFSRVAFMARPVSPDAALMYVWITAAYAGLPLEQVSVTAAEVLALPNVGTAADPWYHVDLLLNGPLAVGAATVRLIEWHCPAAASPSNGWDISYVTALGSSGAASTYSDDATYRGITEFFSPSGAAGSAYDDAFATLATIPAAPANPLANTILVPLPGTGEGCSLDEYQGVLIQWDVSPDALVTEAEVQRFDELTQSWDTIAFVEQDTPVLLYADVDPAQNIVNTYRVRFVRSTGEASDWSAEVTATPVFTGCGLIFVPWAETSVLAAADALGYIWPTEHEWEFLDADRLVMFPVYGADGQVAFRPTETLGDSFEAQIIVNAVATPTPREGRWVFDLLVDMAHNPSTPYVSVLDETGRRWYAVIQVPSGSRSEPGKLYIGTVRVTTLQLVPTPRPIP